MKFFIFAKSFFKVFLNRRNFSSKIFGGFRHVWVLRNDSMPFLKNKVMNFISVRYKPRAKINWKKQLRFPIPDTYLGIWIKDKIYTWKAQSKIIDPSDMDFKLQKNEDWLKDSMEKFSDISSDYTIESIYNKERERVSRTSSIMSKLCS